jgi:hypothetical protein
MYKLISHTTNQIFYAFLVVSIHIPRTTRQGFVLIRKSSEYLKNSIIWNACKLTQNFGTFVYYDINKDILHMQ